MSSSTNSVAAYPPHPQPYSMAPGPYYVQAPPPAGYPTRDAPNPKLEFVPVSLAEMSDPKFGYPYPAQGGYYQGPPVMAPPPQYPPPPVPPPQPSFLEACRAALCCWGLINEGCGDPSTFFCC